jgi:antitoxin (DNA-binding transcriptional repressor) of toxin-antitoxin stability system
MAAVASGESFIVTRNGSPIAELRPLAPSRRKFVPRETIAEVFGRGPHIDSQKFRDDIDRHVDPYL